MNDKANRILFVRSVIVAYLLQSLAILFILEDKQTALFFIVFPAVLGIGIFMILSR